MGNASVYDGVQRTVLQLRDAVDSRALVDQAKGILMHALGCSAEEALQRMRGISQTRNIKVTEVAQRIIESQGRARDSSADSQGRPCRAASARRWPASPGRSGPRSSGTGPGPRGDARIPPAASGWSAGSGSAGEQARGWPGWTSAPVVPSMIVSRWLPTADATTGTPQAIASSATVANGSAVTRSTSRSAERSRAGRSSSPTVPWSTSRSRTRSSVASRVSARYILSLRAGARSGPPAMTSSAPGISVSARSTATSRPCCFASGATQSSRGARRAAQPGPRGRSCRCPRRAGRAGPRFAARPAGQSLLISVEELASTASTLRAMTGSSRSRRGPVARPRLRGCVRHGLCRVCRRLQRGRNVCTTGT